MKKTLLLTLAGLVAISASAQQKFEETTEIGSPKQIKMKKEQSVQKTASTTDNSYYYWENNSRVTSEINTYLGATSPSEGGVGFDTLALYSYKVKDKGTYWQQLVQGIPTADVLTLNSVRFLGKALNPSGSTVNVSVYDKSLSTVLGSKDIAFTTSYGYQNVIFDSPVTSNDTMLIVISMKTARDSISVAFSHNYFNNVDLAGSGTDFVSNLPFSGDGAIIAVRPVNAGILGLIKDDFDFFIIPNFSYDVTANFTTSSLTICENDEVTFTNTGNSSHTSNPVLNFIAWDAMVNASSPAYTIFDYEGNTTDAYVDGQVGTYAYTTAGTFTASAGIMTSPWTSSNLVIDSQNFTVNVSATNTPTFTAIDAFCSGTTAPTLEASSTNTIAITGTWSPATVSNTASATYTFTPDGGQCANDASLDVVVKDCASLEENNTNAFTLFPNPANDVVSVSLANTTEGNITLLSADGKVIETREVSSSVESFNINSLNSGIYFFQVGQTIQKLMVK